MSQDLRFVDPAERPGWDREVGELPGGTFFHSAAWSRVLQRSYSHRPAYACRFDGDRLSGLLPMTEVDSPLTGRRGVSLPFTDECEPIGDPGGLIEAVLDRGRDRRWKYTEMRCNAGEALGPQPYLSFWGHLLDLSPGETPLFNGLESSVRRGIRKAQTREVRVEVRKDAASMEIYYALHRLTRRRHGLPPQPPAFFKLLGSEAFASDSGRVVLAWHKDMPLAGAVFLTHRPSGHAIYKYGASDRQFQDLRANNLVMWEGIRWLAGEGFKNLDLGRTSLTNAGLRRYKLGFGVAEREVRYFRYDYRLKSTVAGIERTEGAHNGFFRLMPLWASRMLGSLMYRHLT